ncbi:hypothetical protein [Paludisphaera rhizosphaerae]|uniref:hypothetical protein n=1 Tax=Paludisphaera rhizosphaerae TaxID=2711216 RepID=UPI0013EBA05A|nr:hypothetical protein [Paludisphaera rhizosphaerae]
MIRKATLLPILAGLVLGTIPLGCGGQSTPTPISPEEAKKIVGEDPDYLPGLDAKGKAPAKKH